LQISYPKSFLKLLLIGFALAMLPLLVAFVNANIYFEKLTKQSLFNMSQAVETTRSSRILLEELAVMERSARQYFVLHDKLLLTNYMNSHVRFNKAIITLLQLPISKTQQPQLLAIAEQENKLFTTISKNEEVSFDQSMIDSFTKLTDQGYKITYKNNELIDSESALFKAEVARTQRLLFWQTLTLVPLALLFAGIITWMIARPIRRMDAAIHQLGKGNYEHDIAINGPGDLRKLGSRLNWLRIALKDLHHQKQRFLQRASHELKTPLTAIREASEILNDEVAGKLNPQQNEVVHILRENSLRLQKMIENLLNYAEIQFNATENKFCLSQLDIRKQSLRELINNVLQAYSLSIIHKEIKVHTSVEDIMMQVDVDKLQTVFDNIISNAVKFTPNLGEINIRASQSKSVVSIEIKDTGPGFNQANLAGLFEPFSRGEQPNNSLVTGSGLGLFIAKEALNSLKGEIILEPSKVGAYFILRLPLNQTIE
jgi:two-component system sensor histidine kinase GlrK